MFWCLPVTPTTLGEAGFLKGVRDLIALFAAFFVVALAAVATFSRESLDLPMEGTTPTLDGKELSRRQFVCYLFGYLAVLSFALFLAAVLAQIITPSLRAELPAQALWWVKAVSGTVFASHARRLFPGRSRPH
jgi:Trk-type K+ transport system membrane component